MDMHIHVRDTIIDEYNHAPNNMQDRRTGPPTPHDSREISHAGAIREAQMDPDAPSAASLSFGGSSVAFGISRVGAPSRCFGHRKRDR